MPELPEVETALRGIAPYLTGQTIRELRVREPRLRWPIPPQTAALVAGQRILAPRRRAKYLLLELERGTLLLHLGMSGSLRVLPAQTPAGVHDHLDLVLANGRCLRLRDPRRFGALLWTEDPAGHPLLRRLGPEPLGSDFTGAWLHRQATGRRVAVKPFIMDAQVVVGVGNIYASESLWRAGIHPNRAAGRIAAARFERLAEAIREVLGAAIQAGGTSLRDFVQEDGNPGYFARQLRVYGRAGEPCPGCGRPIRQRRIGQRSSFYCPVCQR